MIKILTLQPSKSAHNDEFQPLTEVIGLFLFEKMIAFSFGHNQKSAGVRSKE